MIAARALALVILFCAGPGCGAHGRRPVDLEESADGAGQPAPAAAAIARELARRGDHLGASRYWEAALADGVPERDGLASLIAAEIRAGRLRAALVDVARLEDICPGRPELTDLRALLTRLISNGADAPRPETQR